MGIPAKWNLTIGHLPHGPLNKISDVPGAVAAVEQALADGTLSRAALDESVLRILQLKLAHGIVDMPESG